MKIKRGVAWTIGFALSGIFALSPVLANAANVNFSPVQTLVQPFNSLAIDPATGYFYELHYYGNAFQEQLSVYSDVTQLAANNPSSTVSLSGGFYGTYIAANSGTLYGGYNNNGAVGSWSLSTGSVTGENSYAALSGATSFNWGGDTTINVMQDSTGLYALGGSANNQNGWALEKIGPNLSGKSAISFAPLNGSSLGYAFMIDGTLFTGASFNSNVVNEAINASTGVVTPVSYTLQNIGPPNSSYYLSDFTYDPITNTLYAFDSVGSVLYAAPDASAQFGLASGSTSSNAVPAPSAPALFLIALAALTIMRRRAIRV
jgi:hypothetical protein